MQIYRIDHVQLAMPRGQERLAIDFYYGLLGIPHVPKPPVMAARGGCWFINGDVQIHLGVEDDFRPAKKAHPALLVHGLRELVEHLNRHHVASRWDTELAGYLRVFIEDPFGNRIELMEVVSGES